MVHQWNVGILHGDATDDLQTVIAARDLGGFAKFSTDDGTVGARWALGRDGQKIKN
jgi:hypothetical protein